MITKPSWVGKSPAVSIGTLIQVGDTEQWLLVSFVDYQKMEGGFMLFPDFESAENELHEVSLRQLPDWHKANCLKCKLRAES